MARKMHQEQIVWPALREQVINFCLDDMGRLIAHSSYGEIADFRITKHRCQRLGVEGSRLQAPQALVLVFAARNNQGLPLPGHYGPSTVVCRLTNSLTSCSWSAAVASDSSNTSPLISSRTARRIPRPRANHCRTADTIASSPLTD